MNNPESKRFIALLPSQREVSLMVARDAAQITEFAEELLVEGFIHASTTEDLINWIEAASKVYYIVNGALPKQIRDIVVQYPTGQIEVEINNSLQPKILAPTYRNTALVLLISQQDLIHVEESGGDLLSNTGLTYRS